MTLLRTGRACLLFLYGLALAGCETSIIIDTPPLEPALVVFAFPQPDSVWSVYVGKVVPLSDDRRADSGVKNATVEVYEDEALLETLVYDPIPPRNERDVVSTARYVSSEGTRIREGATYRLVVSAAGYPTAVATEAQPLAPEVRIVTHETELVTEDRGGFIVVRHFVTATLSDPLGDDTYEMRVLRRRVYPESRICDQYSYCEPQDGTVSLLFTSGFPSLRDDYSTLELDVPVDADTQFRSSVFRDDLFEATLHTFNLSFLEYIDAEADVDQTLSVFIARVSEPFAEYQIARSLQDFNEGNPFAEPAPLYTNIENGHGVLGGLAGVRLPVPLPALAAR